MALTPYTADINKSNFQILQSWLINITACVFFQFVALAGIRIQRNSAVNVLVREQESRANKYCLMFWSEWTGCIFF